MASFSPAPPRRSTRLRQHENSPARRVRAGSSRLTTPVVERPVDHFNASPASAMDVDEDSSILSDRSGLRAKGEAVYAKSDQLSVSFYADLPVEVSQVLKNAGMPVRDWFS